MVVFGNMVGMGKWVGFDLVGIEVDSDIGDCVVFGFIGVMWDYGSVISLFGYFDSGKGFG